jgi:cytochrome c-type biogenesis protein CcmH
MRPASVLTLALLVTSALGARTSAADTSEKTIFQSLFSPCCYRETLDVHVSPVSEQLRMEIRDRLGRHETVDAIVADMAMRYGDQILVRPPGRALTLVLFCGAGVLASGLVGFAFRRARRAVDTETPLVPFETSRAGDDTHLSDALEDELSALE